MFDHVVHVRDAGLSHSSDRDVWQYAKDHELVIVSKDADFHHLSFLLGAPPKVIWIRRGNCSTLDIERLLRQRVDQLREFAAAAETAFMELW